MKPPSVFPSKWNKKKKQLSKQLMEEGKLFFQKNKEKKRIRYPKKYY